MFIETHENDGIELTFLKSANVQAFPCGRRRSSLISADTDGDGKIAEEGEGYYIPFDPEAKLNTEANNRKNSGLNGYTQTYVKSFENNVFSVALAGYLFNINLDSNYNTENTFSAKLLDELRKYLLNTYLSNNTFASEDAKNEATESFNSTFYSSNTKIYANVKLEDLQLFTGFKEYKTSVLRDQTGDGIPSVYLDICNADDDSNSNNYYFSGLSFSTVPLTSIADGYTDAKTRDQLPHTINREGSTINQQLVSLCILEKVNKTDEYGNIVYTKDETTGEDCVDENGYKIPEKEWKIYQPALLPEIRHDATPNSLVLGDTRIEKIEGINPGNLMVENDAVIENNLTVKHNATIENDVAVHNKLTIGTDDNQYVIIDSKAVEGTNVVEVKGNTKLDGTLTATGAVTLQNTLEVTRKVTAYDNLEVEKTITATENLGDTVNAQFKKAEVEVLTATNALYQNNDSNITKPVPILDVVETDDGWQLQFSRVSIIPKS